MKLLVRSWSTTIDRNLNERSYEAYASYYKDIPYGICSRQIYNYTYAIADIQYEIIWLYHRSSNIGEREQNWIEHSSVSI